MKRIVLSTIPDDFNAETDILMGPWCFIGKEHFYPNWENLDFEPDPFKTIEEISRNAKITTDYAESYMLKLTGLLNKINNTEYSMKFWRLLVFTWLLTLVQTTWERQLRMILLLKKYSDEEVEIELVKNNINWHFKDTLAHQQNGLLKHLYNHWLFSRLLESRIPPNWKVKWVDITPHIEQSVYKKKSLKQKLSELFSMKFLSSSVYGIDRFTAVLFDLLLRIKSLLIYDFAKDTIRKHNKVELKWNLNWEDLVKSTLPECFKSIKKFPKKKDIKKRVFLVGPILWYNEKVKLKLAKEIEKGSKIIVCQHGGSYGTSKFFSFQSSIEYKRFKFISWGWKEQENYKGNILPLCSPLLSKYKYKRENNNILLVSTRAMLYSYRITSIPQAKQQIEYRRSKIDFIKEINKDIYSNFLYRPDSNEMGSLSDKKYLKTRFPDLKILTGNLHKETMHCKLLIIDHPDTTLNIALAANIPTICFWDKSVWHMCRQAEAYFKELRDAGILFNNGKEAAEKVNEIWDDVHGWWKQPKVQKSRKEFAYQYARTSKHWRLEWIKAIWKI